jgi:hypothetical protein
VRCILLTQPTASRSSCKDAVSETPFGPLESVLEKHFYKPDLQAVRIVLGAMERENLYYCLGGNLAEHEKYLGKEGAHKRRHKSLRKFFEGLNDARIKRWTPLSAS